MKVKYIGNGKYKKELVNNGIYEASPYTMRTCGKEWFLIKNEFGEEVYYDSKYFEFIY